MIEDFLRVNASLRTVFSVPVLMFTLYFELLWLRYNRSGNNELDRQQEGCANSLLKSDRSPADSVSGKNQVTLLEAIVS